MENDSSESTPLLPVANATSSTKPRCCNTANYCIKSRAAHLILLWNFAAFLTFKCFYDDSVVIQLAYSSTSPIIISAFLGLIVMFAPMAGLITDIKLSRYKAVVCSSRVILVQVILAPVLSIWGIFTAVKRWDKKYITVCMLVYVGTLVFSLMLSIINGIQFGMDQLQDSPTEDLILFIHWYVWIYYASSTIPQLMWNLVFYDQYSHNMQISGISIAFFIFFTVIVLFTLLLCAVRHRKAWFLLEPPGVNAYRLVYNVVKFACQHKFPLNRSAFTYSEDELPSRMDLGKQKYGGPFTTKQVEDVKAFWGILKVIICVGPAFLLQTVTHSMLAAFARHSYLYKQFNDDTETAGHKVHIEGVARHIIISNGLLSPLLVVICIPLYLCLIRPHILYQIPGMLKRVGMGIVLMILSLACAFIMDMLVHVKKPDTNCMFMEFTNVNNSHAVIYIDPVAKPVVTPLFQNIYFLISQHALCALINMIVDTAILEFICSQSPYSMKGLLLGFYFSVKSFFQAVAVLYIIPFGAYWKVGTMSCGSGFYLSNTILGVLELGLFTYVAKRYKNRMTGEITNIYRYAEEYYSVVPSTQ